MKVYLVRHGETESDKQKSERILTDRGVQQMKKCARELDQLINPHQTIILSTASVRTLQSSIILSQKLKVPINKKPFND